MKKILAIALSAILLTSCTGVKLLNKKFATITVNPCTITAEIKYCNSKKLKAYVQKKILPKTSRVDTVVTKF